MAFLYNNLVLAKLEVKRIKEKILREKNESL